MPVLPYTLRQWPLGHPHEELQTSPPSQSQIAPGCCDPALRPHNKGHGDASLPCRFCSLIHGASVLCVFAGVHLFHQGSGSLQDLSRISPPPAGHIVQLRSVVF